MVAKILTWRFTLEPLLDGKPVTQKYGYVVPDPKDDLDAEDLFTYMSSDFRAAMDDYKKNHTTGQK